MVVSLKYRMLHHASIRNELHVKFNLTANLNFARKPRARICMRIWCALSSGVTLDDWLRGENSRSLARGKSIALISTDGNTIDDECYEKFSRVAFPRDWILTTRKEAALNLEKRRANSHDSMNNLEK